MHQLSLFFDERNRLNAMASNGGFSNPPPSVVLPHLANALDECLANHQGLFQGTPEQLEYLVSASRVMSIFAVRESKPRWIKSGLLALMYENAQTDGRLTLTHFALLNHAARKIDVDFDAISKTLISQLELPSTEWLSAFLTRPDDRKSIAAFGYAEITREGRFDFKSVM